MISAIVVNHDGRQQLARCLAELAGRAAEVDEVVVVDNASTDGSVELVRRRFPGCRLLPLPSNLGFGAANNRGVAEARGERLLLLNSDAWLADGALGRLAAALDADARLAAAVPQLLYPDGRLQFSWAPETGVWGEALQKLRNRWEGAAWNHRLLPPLLRAVTGPGWYSAACMLLRRQAFEEVGGFDESIFLYFEDVDLCRRLRRAGWRLAQVPDARAFHVKGGSQRGAPGELEYRRGQLRYYRKHRPAWENRTLHRRLARKAAEAQDAALRQALRRLLDEAAAGAPQGGGPSAAG